MTLNATAAEDSLEKYKIYSKREIATILRNLKEKKQNIRMLWKSGHDGIVTSILYVDPDNKHVVLDSTSNAEANEQINGTKNIHFEGVLDRIKIFFTADEVTDCVYQNGHAFLINFPEELIRIQRREYYRVVTYRGRVRIPIELPETTLYVETAMRDLSAGGVCVLDESMKIPVEYGTIFHNSQIILPDVQPVTVSLQVRNYQDVVLSSGKTIRRIGCQFAKISNAESALIQRCITKMEREKLDPFIDD